MNTIRNKFKHGFGNKRKTAQRSTVGQTSLSTNGSKPDRVLNEESKSPNYKSKKSHSEKSSKNSSTEVSQTKSSDSEMEKRKSKHKTTNKNQKNSKIPSNTVLQQVSVKDDRVSLSAGKQSRFCDSTHEGRIVLHTNFGIHIEQLFQMLFTYSDFYKDFQAKRNTTELQVGEWRSCKDSKKVRIVRMTLALQSTLGPKTAKIIEEHTIRNCSQHGELYSIDVTCTHEGIPYADVFNILVHYCLLGTQSNKTEMIVYGNVNFIKPTWAVIKTFIMKHSYEGLSIYFCDLQEEILKEINKSNDINSNYKT